MRTIDMKRNVQGVYEPAFRSAAKGDQSPRTGRGQPQRGFLDEATDALGSVVIKTLHKELKKRGLGGLLNV